MVKIDLLPLTPEAPLMREAARVYAAVWGRNWQDSMSFFRKYAHYPHFYGYVAQHERSIVGMGFGTQSLPGQWWHDKVTAHLGAGHPALQDAWVLTELAVLDAFRNSHIGSAIHNQLLREQPLPNALLSTQVNNSGAQRFYTRHGWRIIHEGFAFGRGREHYVIMHRVCHGR